MKKKFLINILILVSLLYGCGNTNPIKTSDHLEILTKDMGNNNYEFIERTEIIIDNRLFKTEDIPKNIPEEIVLRNFLYTITAEFDKKYAILADIESHVISIENEKRLFQEGVFVQSYIIHRIITLTEEQYSQEKTVSGKINPLFYWGWQQRINEFGLIDYKIVNADFSVVYSNGGMQYGNGTYNRSFIVGKKPEDYTYKIYDFGFM
jgi:hypothetical protein